MRVELNNHLLLAVYYIYLDYQSTAAYTLDILHSIVYCCSMIHDTSHTFHIILHELNLEAYQMFQIDDYTNMTVVQRNTYKSP